MNALINLVIEMFINGLIDWQEDAGELEKALTPDERAKLYDAIGYQEDAEEGTLEYPRRLSAGIIKIRCRKNVNDTGKKIFFFVIVNP